jgi:hypothetical protein
MSTTRRDTVAGGELVRMPKAGGSVEVLLDSSIRLLGLALDATHAYVTELDDASSDAGCAYRVPLAGGSSTTLACGLCNPQAIAVSAADAWVANFNCVDGELVRIPLAGGPTEDIVDDSPIGVVAGAGQVYWSHHFGVIGRRAVGGGPIVTTPITYDATQGMWADADGLYVGYLGVSGLDGKIARIALDGTVTELAHGFFMPEIGFVNIGVDATHVYFAGSVSFAGHEIMRTPK